MQGRREDRRDPQTVKQYNENNLKVATKTLNSANQVIANTKSYSDGMAFEIVNSESDLSGSATLNIEQSISGKNWKQAVDSSGNDLTYTITSGSFVSDVIKGIPEGVFLRFVIVEDLTGTLDIYTRQ